MTDLPTAHGMPLDSPTREQAPASADAIESGRRRFVYLLPLGAFAAVAGGFAVTLGRDPSKIPSALIGKSVPEFALPPVQGRVLGLSTGDLKGVVSWSIATASSPASLSAR